MTPREPLTLPAPLHIRLLAVAMTCVVSGLGILHFITEYVPERWTKHSYTGPLYDSTAEAFGVSMFFFGLLPLMLTASSRRAAMWIGIGAVALGVSSLFIGPLL